jgi:hypothetical protein
VHFVQMWVLPDRSGVEPGYEQLDVTGELDRGGLVVDTSGMGKHAGDRAVSIRQEHAALYARGCSRAPRPPLPASPLAPPVRRARQRRPGGHGPAAHRGTRRASPSRTVSAWTAGPDGAEVLVWEMHATLG